MVYGHILSGNAPYFLRIVTPFQVYWVNHVARFDLSFGGYRE